MIFVKNELLAVSDQIVDMPLWLMVLGTVTVVFVVYQFITADLQPFIYFQF